MSDTPYYTDRAFRAAERYWDEKDVDSVKLDRARLQAMIDDYIQQNNTCALATGTGDYVRCTPIEYSYHDGCFWMFSEGGKKVHRPGPEMPMSALLFMTNMRASASSTGCRSWAKQNW